MTTTKRNLVRGAATCPGHGLRSISGRNRKVAASASASRRVSRLRRAALLLGFAISLAVGGTASARADVDLAIIGGRVIDPETGLDAIRNVGISGGKIVAVTTDDIRARRLIDARNLVVSPGFIDLHSHGQQLPAARMQAFDGVTTALELELGMLPIDRYYAEMAREGRPIHYGASASWAAARQAVMDQLPLTPSIEAFQKAAHFPNWSSQIASDAQIESMASILRTALDKGALGIGFNLGYAPPSGRKEYYEINRLAASYDVPTFTHVRFISTEEPLSSFEAFEEMVAVSASTGAHMHVSHLNSTTLRDIPRVLRLIADAQSHQVPITVESYPYPAASTVIGAAMFRGPNWQERLGGVRYEDFEYEGRALDEASFKALQAKDPGAIIVYKYLRTDSSPQDQAMLDQAVLFPGSAIASDTMPWTVDGKMQSGDQWPLPANAFSHPRSAGTFSRFLREYVRERRLISLPDALRRITLVPAQILEKAVPQMRSKGRLQVGADADISVFDPEAVTDRATFSTPSQSSSGMRWVIVSGTPVIAKGVLDRSAFPGRPIRRPELPAAD
tara:strand:- start:128016 stop:129701 length:1686 start_codon:yes stop_codon:yes gene_type:complete